MRDELGTSIGGDVGENSMLRKDMEEEFSQLWKSDHVVCRDEDALFREMIHNY